MGSGDTPAGSGQPHRVTAMAAADRCLPSTCATQSSGGMYTDACVCLVLVVARMLEQTLVTG